ncbi:hypothetical protein [Dysgonomonas macrotermitis]|uniref:DUF4405 domain-containing protein n=1 Tax=Dysgonomonas macrotermitis TaxID=1346286 RepID=A0A1M5AYW2_9BACT|nr:hypothetical protein [Dysgonomonas macrotermitis]SHF35418.1 hypothetical protein SAMN05444362_105203 [Dysgonomonas macrotermitis]
MQKKISLTKGKSIFIIDLILIPVFVLVIYTGFELHFAGGTNDHDIWSYWCHLHIIVSIISLIVGWLHVKAHLGWYKSIIKNGLGKKSKITLILTFLFVILILTGIVLIFFVEGGNSALGLWHYRFGLVMTVLLVIHLIARFPLLLKGLKKK